MRWEGDKGGRASLGPPWTEEKQATLRRMWGGKSSASDIARAFGDGTTRNAVIGKVHRLGLGRGSAEIVAAKRRGGQAKGAATKRARTEKQIAASARALVLAATARAEKTAAKPVEDVSGHKPARSRGLRLRAKTLVSTDKPRTVFSAKALAELREKQAAIGLALVAKVELALIDNPAFVKVEKPIDLYSHMRSDKSFHDAVAALTR